MRPSLRPALVVGLALLARPAAADAPEPIRYTVRFPAPQTHYAEVEAVVPAGEATDTELMMPVWTPGSYLVREYARHVEDVTARGPDGKPLAVEKTRKNRWKVTTGGAKAATVSYRVYGRQTSVQDNWVDASFAILNGAATFLTRADDREPRPHEVTLVPPPGWLRTVTGLPDATDRRPHHYVAPDFDTLVDSPIYAGTPAVYEFEVEGKNHYLVNEGEGGVWDGPRSARDAEAIVREQAKFWGGLPYDKYVFFNILTEAGGGLEHKNSTVLMFSRWGTRTRKMYRLWLDLVSHEFFHTWNVKRLRPAELGPFDYEREVPTRSLWVAEGLTDYYGRLLVRRAGLITRAEYFEGRPHIPGFGPEAPDVPTTDIGQLQTTPGRLVQPLESSSFDSWIKFYRPDENAPNTAISYYTKGSVVGFLLDAHIRRLTDGARGLDDVMRAAYERYSGARGYTPEEFRAVASDVAGADLSEWFRKALNTTEELDYAEALDWYGLRFRAKKKPDESSPEGAPESPEKAWLGLVTRPDGGRLVVAQVRRGTPGFDAGFNVGDEILAVGDYRVRPEQWSARMEQYRPNETVSILVARRDRLLRLDATFGAEPSETWRLEPDPKASDAQKAHLKAWVGE